MKKWLLIVIALALLGLLLREPGEVYQPPGVLAPKDPMQTPTTVGAWSKGDYVITPLASFHIQARVLERERYRFGRESDLSPVDFVMGWGPMSDSNLLDTLEISQGHRWYHWRADDLVVPTREIQRHSANMHMIPADDSVQRSLLAVHPGEVVEMDGYLVEARASDGWHWRSSLSRDDTGGGSCELIWVDRVGVE